MFCLSELVKRVQAGNVHIYVRFLAKIVGQIISLSPVLGNEVRFGTRGMYNCILDRLGWNSQVYISSEALGAAIFWLQNIDNLNNCSIGTQTDVEYALNVLSGASETGYGAFIDYSLLVDQEVDHEVIGTWSKLGASNSSTWRELEAMKRSLQTIGQSVKGQHVQWYTDNKNVCNILNTGSKKPYLHRIAKSIKSQCKSHCIDIKLKWIPRSLNQKAKVLIAMIGKLNRKCLNILTVCGVLIL